MSEDDTTGAWRSARSFGNPDGPLPLVVRPSAYALLTDAIGRLAVVRTPAGCFLPGGGREPGESPEATVVREAREECGLAVRVGRWRRHAVEWVHAAAEGACFEKRSTFCDATATGAPAPPVDDDHALEWLGVDEAALALSPASHRWAVAEWSGTMRGHEIPFSPSPLPSSRGSMPSHRRLIDVSHTVEHGMITYKGFPAPIVCDWLSREASREKYAPGTEFHIGRIDMIANTGTYVDSPFHRYEHGRDLSELPLESLADLDCVVVRVDPAAAPAIDHVPLSADRVRGRAVLFHTGWDRHWRTDAYFEGHPHLTARAGEWLARAGAALVGIDSLNIDSVATGERPVHTVLLGTDIPICEHMRGLDAVPVEGGRLFAVPVKVKGFGTFPVRAFVAV